MPTLYNFCTAIERTFEWLGRCLRLDKTLKIQLAFVKLARSRLMNKIARVTISNRRDHSKGSYKNYLLRRCGTTVTYRKSFRATIRSNRAAQFPAAREGANSALKEKKAMKYRGSNIVATGLAFFVLSASHAYAGFRLPFDVNSCEGSEG